VQFVSNCVAGILVPPVLQRGGSKGYANIGFEISVMEPDNAPERVVGRRLKAPDPLSVLNSNKAGSIAWRKAFGGVRVPRGVHRFQTHEEANNWLWQMISRPKRN
jgi:hypothetical protein